jgi:kinetochore protein Mis13/DSN1
VDRAVEEDEAWKKVGYVYDTYMKKGRTELEQRLSVSQQRKETLTPSEKAKGKQRATELDWGPREHELPESFRHGVGLANSVLGIRAVGDQRIAGSSSRRRVTIGTGMGNEEMEAELERRILEMEFKADHLYALASTARTSLDVIERTLDQRFEQLNLHLTARSGLPRPVHDPGSGSGAQILSTYVKQDPGMTGPDAMDVMRALARVDMERPPAMVGDEARRAVREVQRAGESGIGAVGDRRLTGLPPSSGLTPRKVPGTPRRGSTPGRERER